MRRPHIWTIQEIHSLPEFDNEHGWFHGLVRDGAGVLHLAEILPGIGYGEPFWRGLLRHPSWLLDVFRYRPPVASRTTYSTASVVIDPAATSSTTTSWRL